MGGHARPRVGLSLFTMTPRLMTGTASYARGLLGELARPESPIEPVVIVNKLMRGWMGDWCASPLHVCELRSIPLRDTPASRLALIAQALALPASVSGRLPHDLDLMHYPLTLPFPTSKHPTVVTVHDMQHHDQPHFFSRRQHRWRRRIYDAPAKSAAVVVTVSQHAKQRIVGNLGIPPERIEAIVHGIDHDVFSTASEDDEALLVGLDLPSAFVLYPAGMWPHKNHLVLIEAIALLESSDVSLVLTGPTFGRLERVMAEARRLGVGERVKHLGFVSSHQLAALYRRAGALVFPSLYEGFGAPPLEAMACGCPVVSSREGSLPEACGPAAMFFDARSPASIARAVDEALADEATRLRLRQTGLAWARRFTWGAAAERHVAAYRRALDIALIERRDQLL